MIDAVLWLCRAIIRVGYFLLTESLQIGSIRDGQFRYFHFPIEPRPRSVHLGRAAYFAGQLPVVFQVFTVLSRVPFSLRKVMRLSV